MTIQRAGKGPKVLRFIRSHKCRRFRVGEILWLVEKIRGKIMSERTPVSIDVAKSI